MYAPPPLGSADALDLIQLNGGPGSAARLLGVSPRQMRRYLAGARVPLAHLRLLWYASPHGRAAAEIDAVNELRLRWSLAAALERENARLRAQLVRAGLVRPTASAWPAANDAPSPAAAPARPSAARTRPR